ncbi:hypothetical protein JAAARDRAFT_50158 [Jaapia argillacea MUCL 33604]|uniref:Uncharacterized protein n=1 Tax=Jaapia argillacea MUCL 33604 TaxID=933084 RepID=A0A067PR05_9AGAM|nr:hypothetical protein JAAARDRAFT_50158 [Jaapia argillacea MUCL 33604]
MAALAADRAQKIDLGRDPFELDWDQFAKDQTSWYGYNSETGHFRSFTNIIDCEAYVQEILGYIVNDCEESVQKKSLPQTEDSPPQKKKRGHPRKHKNVDEELNAQNTVVNETIEPPKKKRGRPPKANKKEEKEATGKGKTTATTKGKGKAVEVIPFDESDDLEKLMESQSASITTRSTSITTTSVSVDTASSGVVDKPVFKLRIPPLRTTKHAESTHPLNPSRQSKASTSQLPYHPLDFHFRSSTAITTQMAESYAWADFSGNAGSSQLMDVDEDRMFEEFMNPDAFARADESLIPPVIPPGRPHIIIHTQQPGLQGTQDDSGKFMIYLNSFWISINIYF